jgi:hypothetical protein
MMRGTHTTFYIGERRLGVAISGRRRQRRTENTVFLSGGGGVFGVFEPWRRGGLRWLSRPIGEFDFTLFALEGSSEMRNTIFLDLPIFGSLVVGDAKYDDAPDGFASRLSCPGLDFVSSMFQGSDGCRKGSAGDPDDTRIPNRWNPVIPFPLRDAYVPHPPAVRSDPGAWRCRVPSPPMSIRSVAEPIPWGGTGGSPTTTDEAQGQLTKTSPTANDASKATTCKAVIRPPLTQGGATCGMTLMAADGIWGGHMQAQLFPMRT